jgi:hypothetical protein
VGYRVYGVGCRVYGVGCRVYGIGLGLPVALSVSEPLMVLPVPKGFPFVSRSEYLNPVASLTEPVRVRHSRIRSLGFRV